jgi:hypothetical protein
VDSKQFHIFHVAGNLGQGNPDIHSNKFFSIQLVSMVSSTEDVSMKCDGCEGLRVGKIVYDSFLYDSIRLHC